MAKIVKDIDLNIKIKMTSANEFTMSASADITIVPEEYPEFSTRKGMAITLTPEESAAIHGIVKGSVLPAADAKTR